jgi:hypothetical protein
MALDLASLYGSIISIITHRATSFPVGSKATLVLNWKRPSVGQSFQIASVLQFFRSPMLATTNILLALCMTNKGYGETKVKVIRADQKMHIQI